MDREHDLALAKVSREKAEAHRKGLMPAVLVPLLPAAYSLGEREFYLAVIWAAIGIACFLWSYREYSRFSRLADFFDSRANGPMTIDQNPAINPRISSNKAPNENANPPQGILNYWPLLLALAIAGFFLR